jgi:uncharacterized protein YndB with AHSA1/START domain
MKDRHTRALSSEITLDASPEAVWKAITDPEELVRWFPFEAEAVPGPGGHLTYHWGTLRFVNRIEVWEPGRRLRMTWGEAGGPSRLAVDWYLEGRAGGTTLRLVHSGFAHDAPWDGEYDGIRRGWMFELASLRLYLHEHSGRDRRVFWIQRPFSGPAAEAWARLTGPDGIVTDGAPGDLGAGDRYALTLCGRDRLEGRVLVNAPPFEFGGTVASHGNGLMRFGHEDCGQGPVAHLWLSTWRSSQADIDSIEMRWRTEMTRLFP